MLRVRAFFLKTRAGFSKHRRSRGVAVMGLTLKNEPAPYYPPRPELPEGMEVPVV